MGINDEAREHKEVNAVIIELKDIKDFGIENMDLDDLDYLRSITHDLYTYNNFVKTVVNGLEVRIEEEPTDSDKKELQYYSEKTSLLDKHLPKLKEYTKNLEELLIA